MSIRRYAFLALVIACLCLAAAVMRAGANPPPEPQVWWEPKQDYVDWTLPPGHRAVFTKYDFPAMLAPNAPWQTAAARLGVLYLAGHVLEGYPDLAPVIAMTNRYKFKIATAGSMVAVGDVCPAQVGEGRDASKDFAREVVAYTRRWKMAGGRLDYIIMDSPFFFGYDVAGKPCHFTIDDVARRAATTFREIQKLYPDIEPVDADGPGGTPVDTWLREYKQWLDAFKREAGRPITALAMDYHWVDTWHTGYDVIKAVRDTTAFLHKEGVAAGLYINADDQNTDDAGWMNANRAHLHTLARARLGLDFVLLVSWMKFPERNLPETDPNAYSSLVNEAFAAFKSGR